MYDNTIKGRYEMQNYRYLEILKELIKNDNTTTMKDLSILLNVSYKTVQNDIHELKDILIRHGALLQSKKSLGLHLEIWDDELFLSYMNELKHEILEGQGQKEDFEDELTLLLLTSEDYVKIDDLVAVYYFSRTKISATLKSIQDKLKPYHCEIVSKPFYGICIQGEEKDIRKFIHSIYPMYIAKIDQGEAKKNIEQKELAKILKEYGITTSSTALETIYTYLIITIQRMSMKKGVEMDVRELNYCLEMKEYSAAQSIAEYLKAYLKEAMDVNEIASLAQLLSGNRKYDQRHMAEFEASVHHDLDRLLHKILDRVKEKFHQDLKDDFELYVSLGLHMIPLISRIRFDFGMNNPLLDDIKKNYPLAYEIAVEVSLVLYEEFDIKLNEDEIGYFALHFHLALERKKQETIQLKNVLIVCSSGGGLAKLLAFKVRVNFDRFISRIDTADIHEITHMDLSQYDYVLTTVPLPSTLNKPTLQISHMLNNADMKGINEMLVKEKDEYGLLDVLSSEDFFADIEGETKEEVVLAICDRLKRNHVLQDDFYEQIWKREALFTTEIDNRIAFPHPLVQKSNETFLSMCVLPKPIRWTQKLVQVVIIGTVKQGDSSHVQRMYEEFATLASDWERIRKLIKKPSYQTLTDLIYK